MRIFADEARFAFLSLKCGAALAGSREHNNMIVSSREIIITNRAQWGAVICPNILIGMAVPSTSLFTALEYCKVGRSGPDRESEKESSSEEERISESLESR